MGNIVFLEPFSFRQYPRSDTGRDDAEDARRNDKQYRKSPWLFYILYAKTHDS